QAQNWSATQAGWRMAPVFLLMAVTASFFGRLVTRFGTWRLMGLGYVLLGIAMLAMASFTATTTYGVVAPLFALLGVGMGLAVPATGAAVMAAAPRERTGAASATMNALRQGGMTIGIALLGTILGSRAIASMTEALSQADSPARLAALAVRQHGMPAGLDMAPELFRAALASAFAQGFSLAA